MAEQLPGVTIAIIGVVPTKAKLVIQTGGTLDRESSCPAKNTWERRGRDLREDEGSQEPRVKLLRQRTVGTGSKRPSLFVFDQVQL